MKRLFALMLILSVFGKAGAQVIIQPNVPATGLVPKSQLWNLNIINSSVNVLNCKLNFLLTDRVTGNDLLSAVSGQFTINAGATQVTSNVLNPIQYTALSTYFDTNIEGLIPVGNYTACYTLYDVTGKVNLAEECIQFDVEPLSPPMLILPADSSKLTAAPSQFSWVPPSPAALFINLSYDCLIVAINDGQNAEEAIQQNFPFYVSNDLLTNNFSYPSTATAFESNQWYAWQIVARDNGNYAGKSETWVFKINADSAIQQTVQLFPFVKMRSEKPENGIAPNGLLKLSYYNETSDSIALINIVAINDKNKSVLSFPIPIKQGENLIEINVRKKFNLAEGVTYEAMISDSRKDKWLMHFSIVKYNQ